MKSYEYLRYAGELNIKECVTNKNMYVTKGSDIFLIRALIISKNYDLSNFECLEISIDNNVIWKIPCSLLFVLSSIETSKNQNIITFPPNLFSNCSTFIGTPLVKLFCNITFILRCKYDIPYSIIQKTLYCIEKANKSEYNEIINTYNEVKFINKNKITIENYSLIKISGFFVETNQKMEFIKVDTCGITLFEYDNILIKFSGKLLYKCKWSKNHKNTLFETLKNKLPHEIINIINGYASNNKKYLYWIPLEPEKLWSKDNYNNCMTCQKDFSITFSKSNSGSIHFLYHNIFTIRDGIGFLKYR